MLQLKERPENKPLEMHELKPSVKILLGMREAYEDGNIMDSIESNFALFINGKIVNLARYYLDCEQKFIGGCREMAKSYAGQIKLYIEKMEDPELKNYELENAKRAEYPSGEIIPCKPMLEYDVNVFRETLDAMLGK